MARVRWLFLSIIVIAIVPPIIWGEVRTIEGQHGGDTWRNFIYDFQTLIGGALAIFAAWWTVDAMHFTDERSQQRHQDLIDLSMRADRLRLERALNPNFRLLLLCWRQLSPELKKWKNIETHTAEDAVKLLSQIAAHGANLLPMLRGEQFNEAKYLFPGQVSVSLQLIEKSFETASKVISQLFDTEKDTREPLDVEKTSAEIPRIFRTFDTEYERALQELCDLSRVYGVELQLRDIPLAIIER